MITKDERTELLNLINEKYPHIKDKETFLKNVFLIENIERYNDYMNLSKQKRKESLKEFSKSEIRFYRKLYPKRYLDHNNLYVVFCDECKTTLIEGVKERCNCKNETWINSMRKMSHPSTTIHSKDKTKVFLRLNQKGKKASKFMYEPYGDKDFYKYQVLLNHNNMRLPYRYMSLPDSMQNDVKKYDSFRVIVDGGGMLDGLMETYTLEEGKYMTLIEFIYLTKHSTIIGNEGRIKHVLGGIDE